MDFVEYIYPPNKPLEKLPKPSVSPILYDYLLFIDVSENEEFLLGCSNLTGQFWEGTLYYYKNSVSLLNFDYAGYYISTSTTSDARFIQFDNQSHIVLAEDSGLVKLLSLSDISDGTPRVPAMFYANAPVKQFGVWNNSSKLLIAADRTVAIWDLQQVAEKPIAEYKNYHTNIITSVDTNKSNINLFASASSDRKACIWDDRMEVEATTLYTNDFAGLTSVTWKPSQTNNIIVGTEGGDLYLLDVRQPNEFLTCHHCFSAGIHRTTSNSLGETAVCGDVSELLVLSEDILDEVYISNTHSDFVRGITWANDVLYSCGFDKKVSKHII